MANTLFSYHLKQHNSQTTAWDCKTAYKFSYHLKQHNSQTESLYVARMLSLVTI